MEKLENRIAGISFGTELEYNNISRENAARAIQSVVGGTVRYTGNTDGYYCWSVFAADGRQWKAISDCSLGDMENSAEIVSPILKLADMDTLQNVVRALRAAGARATEKGSQHVHIGARDYLSARQMANLAKIFYRQESIILRAAGTYESRLGRYCQPMDIDFIRALNEYDFLPDTAANNAANNNLLNRAWFYDYGRRDTISPSHYDSHRYRAINFNNVWRNSGTIEFRYFNATNHAGHVKFNILFCLGLAALAHESRAAAARPESRREYAAESGKYDLRVFLLRMGMIGDFWRNARAYYYTNIGGSAAWKHGRPAGR